MAEEDVKEDGDGGDEAEDSDEKESPKGKKKLLIVIAIVILLVVGGLAGGYFTGLLDPVIQSVTGDPDAPEEEVKQSVFYELPSMTVNLNTAGRKARFIKIQVSMELASEADKPKVEAVISRVIDNFNVYLRELRVEDLNGSAGIYRLREELLTRTRAAVAPIVVRDILFKEMLVQ